MPGQAIPQDSLTGLELSHYRILECIGSGGMGVVYRARDLHLDREVAIKVLRPGTIADESARHRFHKEALALSKLNHANIATIHDFDAQEGLDFLVMEFIPGITLDQTLRSGPLAEKESIRLAIQLADGLAAAHEHGIIHCDLKPGNLRVSEAGWLKILDFGLAKWRKQTNETVETQSMPSTPGISGTIPYMAPEQLSGGFIDARTDLHAAGLILYEITTGQRPFAELSPNQLIGAILHSSPVSPRELNPKLSPSLERIIGKCLEKDPDNRYQSAKELSVDLRRLGRDPLSEDWISGVHGRPLISISRFLRKHRLSAAGCLILISLMALLGVPRVREWRRSRALSAPQFRALAVLPLANLSGNTEQEYLADGMTEELITQLGKSVPVRVISRQSVMQFKGTNLPLAEIGQRLKVDAVVEGSVMQSGSRVRVTARLIDVAAEKPLWNNEYEQDMRDVLILESAVTQAIAREIKVKLTPQARALLSASQRVNSEAYEAYLKGHFEWLKLSREGLDNAERYFQVALQKDPAYALAYSGLADVWMSRGDAGFMSRRDTLDKARAAAQKALQLDDNLAEAHVALGNIKAGCDWEWAAAENEFQRAIELNPNNANAHFMYADFLISQKRVQEWQVEIDRALELDPMNFFTLCFYGWHLTYVNRYDEAIQTMQKAAASQDFSSVHMGLWCAYHKKGMDAQAVEEAKRFFMALHDGEVVDALEKGNTASAYRSAMRRAADVLAVRSSRSHVPAVRVARLYAHAGENAQAMYWLEKAYGQKESPLVHLAVARDWDELRADPGFQDLLHRLNLPP
jgi:serine/threonine protein kinase/Tfp pilus assembly protein PilF